MDFLETNIALYAGLIDVIRRGTATVLESGPRAFLLWDSVCNAHMLAAADRAAAVDCLTRHEADGYRLLVLYQADAADFAAARYGFTSRLPCRQAAYLHDAPPELPLTLNVRPAAEDDLPLVAANYDLMDSDRVLADIRAGRLFIGCEGETPVGFVGEHEEGAMGLLDILPAYRSRGYGAQLETFMIRRMLARGSIPFCHVVVGNEASMRLQRRLGLTIAPETLYWMH